jgi:iron complex transport system substrate-binding protein
MIVSRFLLVLTLCLSAASPAAAQTPRRIVSLAPSITETLFEVGAGDRVAGVTSYCVYPRQVLALPKVGGYLTPSYETLAALSPDLVVVLPEHRDLESRLVALTVPIVRVDHRSLDGIVESLVTLGGRCNVTATATPAAQALRQLLVRVRQATRRTAHPRVLICFGRSSDFRRLYAAAAGSVHDDLLTYAGGENVLRSNGVVYPTLSVESVMRLDPDVIVEFAPGKGDADARRRQWLTLDSLRAVKAGRVHVFTEDFLSVPGPRFVRFAETLARALHAGY